LGCAETEYRRSIPSEEKIYSLIIEHDKLKDESYRIIKEWIALNYKSASSVIQLDDKENGIIVLKPVILYLVLNTRTIYQPYNLTIKTKDNKTKLNLELLPDNYAETYPPLVKMVEIQNKVNNIFATIKDALIQKTNYQEF
jgi:hypothetical protein